MSDSQSEMTAKEAIEILKANYPHSYFDQLRAALNTAIFALGQPEIVRCSDCKWKSGDVCTRAVEVPIDDDKYCAWAERRKKVE